jgi:putative SOS response-associated peptidase YedK
LKAAFDALELPLMFPAGAPNLEPQDNIRPTNRAPIIRPLDPAYPRGGLEIVQARWDLVPWFWKQPVKAKKFLATNARSETVHTTAAFKEAFRRRRCLVPADGFYEWTGEKGAKTKWRFTTPGEDLFCIAGLWDRAETADGVIESFTMLTSAPGPDMRPYHDRQVVVLPRAAYADWLDLGANVTDLLSPPPAGAFAVERAA